MISNLCESSAQMMSLIATANQVDDKSESGPQEQGNNAQIVRINCRQTMKDKDIHRQAFIQLKMLLKPFHGSKDGIENFIETRIDALILLSVLQKGESNLNLNLNTLAKSLTKIKLILINGWFL